MGIRFLRLLGKGRQGECSSAECEWAQLDSTTNAGRAALPRRLAFCSALKADRQVRPAIVGGTSRLRREVFSPFQNPGQSRTLSTYGPALSSAVSADGGLAGRRNAGWRRVAIRTDMGRLPVRRVSRRPV